MPPRPLSRIPLEPADGGEIRLESVGPKQLFVMREALAGGFSPVRVLADQNADVLAIPVAVLLDVMGSNRLIARE